MPKIVCRRWLRVAVKLARDRARTLLGAAAGLPDGVADDVEAALFAASGGRTNAAYRGGARRLAFNLKESRNPKLRKEVIDGAVPPARLVAMTSEELASPQQKELKAAATRQRMSELVCAPVPVCEKFECPDCGHRRTRWRQRGRKAVVDRVRIVVTCLNCRHSWDL
ncbi:unnamed protein product [Phaeothamnion confervicola]